MSATRIGLIGTGIAGQNRIAALQERRDCVLVATSAPGESCGPLHFLEPAGLLLRADLDAVIYAGPSRDTARIVSAALGRGLSVLSTRPPGLSVEDVIKLRQAEADAGDAVLQFSFPLHYHGSVTTAKALTRGGSFGRLVSMRGIFAYIREPKLSGRGGVLFDRGMQMLDLMQDLAGPFVEVKSMISRDIWGEPGADDNAFALLRTHEGVTAQLHASATWWRETFRLELGFEDGYIWLDGLTGAAGRMGPEMLITARISRDETGRPRPNPEEQIREFTADNAMALELADFLHAVRGRGPARVGTSQQAFDAMNIVQRVYADDTAWQPGEIRAAE